MSANGAPMTFYDRAVTLTAGADARLFVEEVRAIASTLRD